MISLDGKIRSLKGELQIGGSKSESNRLLVLQALATTEFKIENLSNSKDTNMMLDALANNGKIVDIGLAGTAMRFLTGYFSVQEGREVTLTGSKRMQERPIGELVEALKSLGADITYVKNEGYPPLLIKGKKLQGGSISLNSNISSQFITSLMLIAPKMENGLKIELKGKVVSLPYINMSLQLLNRVGVDAVMNKKTITVKAGEIKSNESIIVESDWSSASYHYSLVASSNEASLILGSYRRDSYQGDSALSEIYSKLGVETLYLQDKIRIQKSAIFEAPEFVEFELNEQPDIAQTIAVTCFNIGLECRLTGLETLRIKETDRLLALKNELEKLGASVEITDSTLEMKPARHINSGVSISTYDDHRMAMAFAPVALITKVSIEDEDVVEKSYPNFWEHLSVLGIKIEEN
ncbi:MAG: 3-phosphoshikimate 1-carboxyvinyltransferase [Ichthyobacteriaceae bacterium]|nr:3-phosphoshikimate 1-carboxyvinyltransferase [Ichthyobacteriaceae bacterium]